MSGGARHDGPGTQPTPLEGDIARSPAAEIRALAEQADAEATAAEALAAAARARARALELRRQADLAEAQADKAEHDAVVNQGAAKETAEKEMFGKERAGKTVPAATEEHHTQTAGPDDAEPEVVPEMLEVPGSSGGTAAESVADTASTHDGTAEPKRWPPRATKSTIAAIAAVVVSGAAILGSIYITKEHRDAVRQNQRAAEFAAAARQDVITLTSLDFNNARQGVQRILDDSTGTFKDDFAKMADDFVKVIEQSKVVEQGTIRATAVDRGSITNDSAVVLVISTSEVTNAAGAKQDPRTYRLIVTITREGNQLKMSKVEFVP